MRITRRQLRKLILEGINFGSSEFIPFPKEAPKFDPQDMFEEIGNIVKRLDKLEADLFEEKKDLAELYQRLIKKGVFGSGNMQQDILKNLPQDA